MSIESSKRISLDPSDNSDSMEFASSSNEGNSEGSEFGDNFDSHGFHNKLPQVQQDMAELLKIKVT